MYGGSCPGLATEALFGRAPADAAFSATVPSGTGLPGLDTGLEIGLRSLDCFGDPGAKLLYNQKTEMIS
jgi:hypothetical protein